MVHGEAGSTHMWQGITFSPPLLISCLVFILWVMYGEEYASHRSGAAPVACQLTYTIISAVCGEE